MEFDCLIPAPQIDEKLGDLNFAGVYLVLFSSAELLLKELDFEQFDEPSPIVREGAHLLYVGASRRSVRSRIASNLSMQAKGSSLRWSVGCILARYLDLKAVDLEDFGEGEVLLRQWISNNALFAIIPTNEPFHLERSLIRLFQTPLNITHRKSRPLSKHLMHLRKLMCPPDERLMLFTQRRIALERRRIEFHPAKNSTGETFNATAIMTSVFRDGLPVPSSILRILPRCKLVKRASSA